MAKGRGRGWRDPAKERFWRRALAQWRTSGLSVRDFCEWQALSEPSFYAWRRELAKRDRERAFRVESPVNVARAVGRFLPVQVVAEAGSDSDGRLCLEVYLPSGVRLCVPAGVPRQTLADVLAALEARAC